MARDFQKQKVYEAEWLVRDIMERGGTIEIYGSNLVLPEEIRFGDLDAVRRYVERTESEPWYREAFPNAAHLRVEQRQTRSNAEKQSQRAAHYQGGAIHIPATTWSRGAWAMREIVVLHEIAHHVAAGDWHGPQFCGAFIYLTTHAIGAEAGLLLADALRGHNARINYIAAA